VCNLPMLLVLSHFGSLGRILSSILENEGTY
jgi:hypothetical protein